MQVCWPQVVTYTSSLRGANTDAGVWVEIHGDQGSSKRTPLANGTDTFERGAADTFLLSLPTLGHLQELAIGDRTCQSFPRTLSLGPYPANRLKRPKFEGPHTTYLAALNCLCDAWLGPRPFCIAGIKKQKAGCAWPFLASVLPDRVLEFLFRTVECLLHVFSVNFCMGLQAESCLFGGEML